MNLFICEKKSEAEAIALALGTPTEKAGYFEVGDNWLVWLYGHIMELYMPYEYDIKYKSFSYVHLPIFPTVWKKKIKEKAIYTKSFNAVKTLLPKSTIVINAGDNDKEGQLLVDEVLEHLGYTGPCKRFKANALDPISVKRAIDAMEDNKAANNYNKLLAALARQRLDWLIGMNGSAKFSLDAGSTLNVGRVKVPAIAMVVRRNREIQNFTPVKHYNLEVYFRTNNSLPFKTIWKMKDDQEGLDPADRLIDVTVIRGMQQKINSQAGIVTEVQKTRKNQAPPLPFSLSTLQFAAGPKFGYSPIEVLNIVQKLYEKKITSYPRSDSNYIPKIQKADAPVIIENLKVAGDENLLSLASHANLNLESKAFNDSKIDAHHAIIPTMLKYDITTLPKEEQNIYTMIAERYLLQFYPSFTYDQTTVTVSCSEESFVGIGKNIIECGWKKVFTEADDDNENENDTKAAENKNNLPDLAEGDKLLVSNVDIAETITTPPPRLNSTSLVKAMRNAYKFVKDPLLKPILKETDGLGTEATRAGIVEQLIASGMLIENKGKSAALSANSAAEELIDFLPDELTYPDKSALMEKELTKIESGELTLEEYMNIQHQYIQDLIKLPARFINKPTGSIPCPICQEGFLKQFKSKKGLIFWGCSCWQKGCKAFFNNSKNAPVIHKCPVCKIGFLGKRTSKIGTTFWGCSNYPDCNAIYYDAKGKPDLAKKNVTSN